MKKILVINEIYSGNLGDALIARAMSELVSELGGVMQLDFSGRDVVSSRPKPIRFIDRVVHLNRRLNECDFVVIGGGQLINGKNKFYQNVVAFILANLRARKPYIFGLCGAGKNFSWLERLLYKTFLNNAKKITVRDTDSAQNIRKLFGLESVVFTDAVKLITLDSDKESAPDSVLICPIYEKAYARYAGETPLSASRDDFLRYCLRRLAESDCDEITIANADPSDLSEAEFVHAALENSLPGNKLRLLKNLNLDSFIALNPRMVITGRMHAGIMFEHCAEKVHYYPFSEKLVAAARQGRMKDKGRIQMKAEFLDFIRDMN